MFINRPTSCAAGGWLVALCAAATASASPAAPVSASEVITVSASVRIDDLDLATDAGRAKLDARLRMTARRLCSPNTQNATSLLIRWPDGACVAKSIADVASIRSSAIERAFAARQSEVATGTQTMPFTPRRAIKGAARDRAFGAAFSN